MVCKHYKTSYCEWKWNYLHSIQLGTQRVTLNYSTKTHNASINVTGWKRVVNQADGKIQVYCNGETCQFSFQGNQSINANGTTTLGTIPSQYTPQFDVTSPVHYQAHSMLCRIGSEGGIAVHNASSTTNVIMRVLVTYALKNKIV